MAKKQKTQVGKSVSTSAQVNQLCVQPVKDKISFTSLSLSGEENEIITEMVKDERDVLVTIDVENAAACKPIQVRGKLKGYKISKTCDAPELINLQFSSGQVEQLTNYIRNSQEIRLTLLEAEPELPLEDGVSEKEPMFEE